MSAPMSVAAIFDGYPTAVGDKKETVIEVRGTASYPADDGYILKARDIGFSQIDIVEISESSGVATWFPRLTYPSHKNSVEQVTLKLYVVATNAEVADAADVSTWIARLRIRGQ